MQFTINKDRIFETIRVDDELCENCPYSRVPIEEMGEDVTCGTMDADNCHRVDNVVEDVKGFVEDNVDMLRFISEVKNEEVSKCPAR